MTAAGTSTGITTGATTDLLGEPAAARRSGRGTAVRDWEEPPGADQVTDREHLTELEESAAAHGTTLLRVAPGRLIGHLAD